MASAYQLESEGNLERALSECRLALQVTPGSAEAHNFLGIILKQLGRQDEAIQAFRTATELDPDFEDAEINFEEAQREVDSTRLRRISKYAWRSAFHASIIFGLAFTLVAWSLGAFSVGGLLGGSRLLTTAWVYLSSSLAVGSSAVVLEIVSKRSRRMAIAFIAGVVGCLFGQLAANFTGSLTIRVVSPDIPIWFGYVYRFLSQAAFGACVGAAFGVTLPGSNFRRTLVASALGFAVAGTLAIVISNMTLSFLSLTDPFDPRVFNFFDFTYRVVSGVIGGASLGWAIGAANAPLNSQRVAPTDFTPSVE
jgi:hypothetical protein